MHTININYTYLATTKTSPRQINKTSSYAKINPRERRNYPY